MLDKRTNLCRQVVACRRVPIPKGVHFVLRECKNVQAYNNKRRKKESKISIEKALEAFHVTLFFVLRVFHIFHFSIFLTVSQDILSKKKAKQLLRSSFYEIYLL